MGKYNQLSLEFDALFGDSEVITTCEKQRPTKKLSPHEKLEIITAIFDELPDKNIKQYSTMCVEVKDAYVAKTGKQIQNREVEKHMKDIVANYVKKREKINGVTIYYSKINLKYGSDIIKARSLFTLHSYDFTTKKYALYCNSIDDIITVSNAELNQLFEEDR